MHFDFVNGFLNSIKEIIWQTEAIYRCPLIKVRIYKIPLHICDTYNYDYMPHTTLVSNITFGFYLIDL